MKASLKPGLSATYRYKVPPSKTVPNVYPVALCEWAAIELLKPHLDWPREQSLGTHVNLSHTAATPPGLTVEIVVTVTEVQGRMVGFSIRASDGIDPITEGTHQRVVIDAQRFNAKIAEKVAEAEGVE